MPPDTGYSEADAMQDFAAILNRLSIAVQFAVVTCLFAYFLLLGRMIKLREVRLWMSAWLADALALAAVFVHAYANLPPIGHRVALVLYLAGKAVFAILIVAGARNHLQPGIARGVSWPALLAFVAAWSAGLGFSVTNLWHAQLAESALIGAVFIGGGVVVLRNPRSRVSRWLGWAMLCEGAIFTFSALLLVPGLWGNQAGLAFLSYSSFIDAGAELMLALACIAVIADRREEQLQYANRELLESQQRLSRLVDTDPLTNLSNRRAMRRAMELAIETGAVIIFIDINRFKEVNDLFGHRVGDTTLQRLARLITEQFRPEDHVIRWGGDEFLVIAPGLDQGSARARVAAIRESLRHPMDDTPAFSIAAGIAELFPGGDATAALEEADRRMYAEKKQR
jgi:diguanylate cyclase (GGDEF)-like protein